MFKSIVLFSILLILSGCGRTADDNSGLSVKSSGNLKFVTVQKSRFIPSGYTNGGHYQTVVRTVNKPEIYAQNDALEKAENYTLFENGKRKDESKITVQKSNNEVDNKILLLLDLSGSIIDGGCNTPGSTCSQLIESSEEFLANVVNGGRFEVAIYYFNARRDIMPLSSQVEFPTGNLTILKNAIEQLKDDSFISNYLKGYDYSTNLYGAVIKAGEKICSWIDCSSDQNFETGSVVLFTDGRDEANIYTKKEMLKSLRENIQYYTIGIGNADNRTLIDISGKAHHFEASADDVQSAFIQAYNDILYNSSFYRIDYCPSTQEGKLRIKILFEDREHSIRAYTQEEKITLENDGDLRCDLY